MRVPLLIASALLLMGHSVNAQQTKTIAINIDGTKINVPLPGDLVPSKSELETMSAFMTKNTPGNKIHEIFAAKGSTEESYLKEGLRRNADVQTVKSLSNKMTQQVFTGVQDLLTKQFDQLMKDVLKEINEDDDTVKTINKQDSGPFIEKDDRYSYLFFSSIKGTDGRVERASAASICFVKGNMVMLNVHSNLGSKKDVEWVKKTAKDWLEATLKANGDD